MEGLQPADDAGNVGGATARADGSGDSHGALSLLDDVALGHDPQLMLILGDEVEDLGGGVGKALGGARGHVLEGAVAAPVKKSQYYTRLQSTAVRTYASLAQPWMQAVSKVSQLTVGGRKSVAVSDWSLGNTFAVWLDTYWRTPGTRNRTGPGHKRQAGRRTWS